ncbi:sugar transporter [Novosphingobium clariflavum]|uniref:Sugar transporter n=1 Tax=Novosphingobium clariflavum TaxID=2029884 RepID=A0ABV6S751_9SPHN|nr:sugar transporter [Novosphingobium clariflavum]
MRRFWIIASGILLWNLLGDAAYFMQASTDLDELARTDPVAAQAFMQMPAWAWGAYAIAVWSGTLGALLLLMRRGSAWAFFALSLAGVIVQFGWSFLDFGMLGAKGPAAAIFPLMILVIAAASVAYARRKRADGTLH